MSDKQYTLELCGGSCPAVWATREAVDARADELSARLTDFPLAAVVVEHDIYTHPIYGEFDLTDDKHLVLLASITANEIEMLLTRETGGVVETRASTALRMADDSEEIADFRLRGLKYRECECRLDQVLAAQLLAVAKILEGHHPDVWCCALARVNAQDVMDALILTRETDDEEAEQGVPDPCAAPTTIDSGEETPDE